MSTKLSPGPFDGMQRAAPDEPVFTLRAHDPLAPDLVHEWVDRRRKAIRAAFGREEITEAKRDLELIQCAEAEELAWQMAAWRKGELAAQAEELEAEDQPITSYSGNASTEEELLARKQYETIKRAGQMLQNAAALINDAATEVLPELGMETERAVLIASRQRIQDVAQHIAPKRASYHPGQSLPEPFQDRPMPSDPTTISGLLLALSLILREPLTEANRLHFAKRAAEGAEEITPGITGGM